VKKNGSKKVAKNDKKVAKNDKKGVKNVSKNDSKNRPKNGVQK
jgi:hypothetical protein